MAGLTSSVLARIDVRGSALGGTRINVVRFTCDNTYPDGGFAVTTALCGFDNGIRAVIPLGLVHTIGTGNAETGYYASFDAADKTLQVFDAGGGAATNPPGEVADNFATINGMVVDCLCVGY